MTILDQLAAHARERVAADQAENSLDVLQTQCRALGRGRGERFRSALAKPELSFICEVNLPLQGGHRERIPLSGDCKGL